MVLILDRDLLAHYVQNHKHAKIPNSSLFFLQVVGSLSVIFSNTSHSHFMQKVDYKMAESTSNEHYPPSGHDEDFVEAVEEDFQVLTRCGHRYCKECLDEHIGR